MNDIHLAPGETMTLDGTVEHPEPIEASDLIDTCDWVDVDGACEADGTLFEVITLPTGIRFPGSFDEQHVLACPTHVAGFFGDTEGRWAVKVHQEAIKTPGPRR